MERLDLPPRIITAVKKAKVTSMHKVICMSAADLHRCTKLSVTDVKVLQQVVAAVIPRPPMQTALELYQSTSSTRLSFGCPVMDQTLQGGILCQGITEITGESASGKTQLCLQLCLSVQLPKDQGGLGGGALYISTEDVFPSKRLHQLIPCFLQSHPPQTASQLRPGDNIYIEHAADVDDLRSVIFSRLPVLLSRGHAKLIVIDSIAALFRVEYTAGEMSKRAKALRSFGAQLHKLSHQYGVAVVCVNQVSDAVNNNNNNNFNDSVGSKNVIPALGLAWSSMVTVRLMTSRTDQYISVKQSTKHNPRGQDHVVKRNLSVVFAPHLPNVTVPFVVEADGIRGLQDDVM